MHNLTGHSDSTRYLRERPLFTEVSKRNHSQSYGSRSFREVPSAIGVTAYSSTVMFTSESRPDDNFIVFRGRIGEDGTFSLCPLEAGTYMICVSEFHSMSESLPRYSSAAVKVTDNEVANVTLPMP